METQSHTPASSEPFFKTERCLITRACQPPKIYQPCTDILPRTMAWLAAGVPHDFIDRAASRIAVVEELPIFLTRVDGDAAIEQANLGEHGMAQVPDPGERYCPIHDLYDCWMSH